MKRRSFLKRVAAFLAAPAVVGAKASEETHEYKVKAADAESFRRFAEANLRAIANNIGMPYEEAIKRYRRGGIT